MSSIVSVRPSALPATAAPFIICFTMAVAGSVTHALGGPSPLDQLTYYFLSSLGVVVIAILVWVFIEIAKLARAKANNPIHKVAAKLMQRLPLLALPVFLLPVFMASYTATKSAIQPLVGFKYDLIFGAIDGAIFGTDPWKIVHGIIGPGWRFMIEYFYVHVWILALLYSKAFVALFARPRFVWTFYTASLLTWFIGGFVVAYLIPAAGPTFANLAEPEVAARFLPLKEHLLDILSPSSPFLVGPAYLQENIGSQTVKYGAGISAMPSMHIAAASIYVLASRGTRWFFPACLFAAIIFVGSIYSGYHYAIDGFVAFVVAAACWNISCRWFASDSLTPDAAEGSHTDQAIVTRGPVPSGNFD
jgi:hypothetical protein